MQLVIAEKPSVGVALAKALGVTDKKDGYIEGNGYIVSWCVGHLVSLANADMYDEKFKKWDTADLPIIPDEWQFIIAEDKNKQFGIIRQLMEDNRVTEVVNACDAGREGELIFRLVYNKALCNKLIKRLWISSMEEKAIRDGFDNLRDGKEYENLYQSALCRAKADWIVGINATRLFSKLYNRTLNVGRVQTPTLAMLYERENSISSFQKEKYFNVHLKSVGLDAVHEKVKEQGEAENIRRDCDGKEAIVKSVKTERKTVNPPHLYDLITFQREANRLYGFTAQQTLDYTQSLYEMKLVTYPRTDSRYITEDMSDTARNIALLAVSTDTLKEDMKKSSEKGVQRRKQKRQFQYPSDITEQRLRTFISHNEKACYTSCSRLLYGFMQLIFFNILFFLKIFFNNFIFFKIFFNKLLFYVCFYAYIKNSVKLNEKRGSIVQCRYENGAETLLCISCR